MVRSTASIVSEYVAMHGGHGPTNRSYALEFFGGKPVVFGGAYPKTEVLFDPKTYEGFKLFVDLSTSLRECPYGYWSQIRKSCKADVINYQIEIGGVPGNVSTFLELLDTVHWFALNNLPVYFHGGDCDGRSVLFAVAYLTRFKALSCSIALEIVGGLQKAGLVDTDLSLIELSQMKWLKSKSTVLKNNKAFQIKVDKALRLA